LPAGRQVVREATAAAAAAGFGVAEVDDAALERLTSSLHDVRRAISDLPDNGN
jgi:hypothetical protein